MNTWIRPGARDAVHGAANAREHAWDAPAAVRTLDAELSTARRFWGGTAAVALAVVGGAVASGVGSAGGAGAVVTVVLIATLLLAGAVWLGVSVLRARHAVVQAFVAWSALAAPLGPASVFTGQLTGKSIARTALAAVLFIAAAFSWSALVPGSGSPDDWAFSLSAVVWAVTFTVALIAVLATEIRGNLARTGRVVRGRR
ncbi:hypothetical protein [Curtobacterium luteum]|uniref:Uncharacterized protein n=1 Tax=Curtobacterium luteum TaxID=33881 RepID=A0A175RQX8_9MICO|nr:hypothetical protein [Curtobacterium luteum]KTR05209.1 hypothetical protein NS184_10575 [Curtobacterium luteum]